MGMVPLQDWWREVWSFGHGVERRYCGIAKTAEGYAVDVFEGDTCLESVTVTTRLEAAYAVDEFRRTYAPSATEAVLAGARMVDLTGIEPVTS